MPDQHFPAAHRIRHAADFQRAYRRRCTFSDGFLLVFACENGLPHARLGVSAARKLGPAVVRNRWKRLIREAFRLARFQLPPGIDLVVIPRAQSPPELADLMASLPRLAARLAAKLAEA